MDGGEPRAMLQREWYRQTDTYRREYLRLMRLVAPDVPDRFEVRRGGEVVACPNRSRALLAVASLIGGAWVEVCLCPHCRQGRR